MFGSTDFVSIDENVVTTKLPSDIELMTPEAETIDLAIDSENEEGEDEPSEEVPTVSKTLHSMTAVSQFLHYSGADSSVFSAYDKLYSYIEKQAFTKNKVRNKMTDYFLPNSN